MNKQTQRYFAEQDNRPPPGVKRMVVRGTESHTFGPYRIVLSTSCGLEKVRIDAWERVQVVGRRHIAGSVRIQLFDARSAEPDEPVAVKRLQVDNWREAQDEMRRLEHALKGS